LALQISLFFFFFFMMAGEDLLVALELLTRIKT